ncbi:glycosyltransferase [Hordeum vulgare]|nr:glycosyltransferase [Hordeum vulgare]
MLASCDDDRQTSLANEVLRIINGALFWRCGSWQEISLQLFDTVCSMHSCSFGLCFPVVGAAVLAKAEPKRSDQRRKEDLEVLFMELEGSQRDEVWKIKPYPRKGDEFCLSHITELTVKSSKVAAHCTRYHDVAMVIFSLTGYTANLFHDFTDVIVPLFTTASQFNGEVQILITDMALWWTIKYHTLLQKLSKYPLINFSKDDQVHCFKHAIVGTHAYMEFTIDASKSPHDVTMVDFNRFMRAAYSLPNETAVASARGEPQGQAQAAHHQEAPHQDVPQPGGGHRHGRGALINSGAI